MKKIQKILYLLVFFLISLISIEKVEAFSSCNIGLGKENSKGYGYYTATPIEPKPGTATFLDGHKINKSNCSFSGWCDNVTYNITMNGGLAEDGSKITDYKIYFIDDDGKTLCSITPSNGGLGIENTSAAGISFDFYLEHGHISKIEAAYRYTDNGETKRNPSNEDKNKSFSVKKRVGDTGSVKNSNGASTSGTDLPTMAVPGYYMCNTTTIMSVEHTQACIKKELGDSLGNCENKVFQDKASCEMELKSTTVTTTTKATTPSTAGTLESSQAGLVQKSNTNASSSYDPSKSNVQCNDITTLVHAYWKYVTVLAPVGLILLITVDLIKAITSGNDDQLKKSANSALKRTIATVVLLMLPILLSLILDWFGLELCI